MDRNFFIGVGVGDANMSLSARRAWIEIKIPRAITDTGLVALRKESVDRNYIIAGYRKHAKASLSARRAWIEIEQLPVHVLRTYGRSPQGERG